MKRGDVFSTPLKFKNNDGTPVDITGSTVYFIVRTSELATGANDTDTDSWVIFKKNITSHTTPLQWETTMDIESIDTASKPIGSYFREIQIKFSNWDVMSCNTGVFQLLPDLNKRA
jgi:hypothetical protein